MANAKRRTAFVAITFTERRSEPGTSGSVEAFPTAGGYYTADGFEAVLRATLRAKWLRDISVVYIRDHGDVDDT